MPKGEVDEFERAAKPEEAKEAADFFDSVSTVWLEGDMLLAFAGGGESIEVLPRALAGVGYLNVSLRAVWIWAWSAYIGQL